MTQPTLEPPDARPVMALYSLGFAGSALITAYYRPQYLYWPWPPSDAAYIWSTLSLIVAILIAYAATYPGSRTAPVAGGVAPVLMLIRSAANIGSAMVDTPPSIVLPSRFQLAWLWLWGAFATWYIWRQTVNPWVGYHQAEHSRRRTTHGSG